jgi:hypothetical protein
VHDVTLSVSEFDHLKFSREFDVTTYQSGSCNALHKDNRFKSKAKTLAPECIFIHIGLKDVLDKRNITSIRKAFEDLIWYLLEETKAKIGISLIIPTRNSSSLNEKIKKANIAIREVVSEARAYKPIHKTCLFSYGNDSVEHQCIFNQASCEVKLTDLGKLIMWTRLGDGLRQTLCLPRKQLRKQTESPRRDINHERQGNQNTKYNA